MDETLDTGTQAGKPSRTDELIGLLSNKIVGQAHALEHMLPEEGHTVLVASSAEAAMDRIEETVPDILLLDHILPDGEGVHLAVQLMKRFPQARAVVMSGAQFDEEEQLLCQRYDIPFLQKPFVAEELLGALEAILLSGGSSRSAMA